MKIKLHTQSGLFSSSKTIVIEAGNIEHIIDTADGSTVSMKDESEYEVKEKADDIFEQIEGKPIAPVPPNENKDKKD